MGADDANYNYLHEDWLGNVRVTSNLQSHAITYDVAYSPYGELYDGFGSAGSQYTQFAGINGNFWSGVTWDASNRELSDYAGRWLSPDPAMSGWNQYAYPTNPNSMTDASGLFGINGPGGGCDYQDCGGDDPCAYGFCDFGGDMNPCAYDISSCWGPDPDMDNTVSPGLPPAANSIFTGEDCVGCWGLGPSPMQVLQAVLSGNLYGALQDVGAVPTNGIDCTSGVCQINPLMDVGPAANNGFTWAWNFTKSFFTFAGGPGNKPTCAGQTLRAIGNELTGGFLGSQAAETSLKAASVYQAGAALNYAANQTNTLGGIGLICPQCSSVFRGMMSQAEVLGELSEAVPVAETGAAAWNATWDVGKEALNGQCAAAFPVL